MEEAWLGGGAMPNTNISVPFWVRSPPNCIFPAAYFNSVVLLTRFLENRILWAGTARALLLKRKHQSQAQCICETPKFLLSLVLEEKEQAITSFLFQSFKGRNLKLAILKWTNE